MNFQEDYAVKLTSADDAVKLVKSCDYIDFGWCTGTPRALDKALAARYDELENVNVRGGILFEKPAIMQVPDVAKHFTWNSWHMSGVERKMAGEDLAFYGSIRYSELPSYYDCIAEPSVAMFQVAPMDAHGYFNFGPNASHMKAVCDHAKHIVVEVNKNMPRCLGGFGESVHISQVDAIVEGNNDAMWTLGAAGEPSEVDKAVANLIVPEIPNGACLQLGIGGMPNAVGDMIAQSDLKDLAVHTEMYVDAFVKLAKAGKITGRCKAIDTGRQVYAFGAGSQEMYDYLDNNPECMSAPVSYTNNISVVSSIDNFISINSAVDVDLFGQIGAESSGTRQISGAGGQLDFVMGAYLSIGGKSFVCLPSTFTDKAGQVHSNIKPTLSPGSIVTDTRANVHYLVTEWGKVNLKGCSAWERAEKIISVAHPDFRDELIAEASKMHIWRK